MSTVKDGFVPGSARVCRLRSDLNPLHKSLILFSKIEGNRLRVTIFTAHTSNHLKTQIAHDWAAEPDNLSTCNGATHAIGNNDKQSADAIVDRPHVSGLYPVLASRSDHPGLSDMEWKNDVLHWRIGTLNERWSQSLEYSVWRLSLYRKHGLR
jgi:hypothetical protein